MIDELRTIEAALKAIRAQCDAKDERTERYRQAVVTLRINACRDSSALAPYIVPFCDAILAGKTAAEAVLEIDAVHAALNPTNPGGERE